MTAGIENFAAFLAATIVFTMTPGIDTFFILNRSLAQGRRAGFYSALGISTGLLIHTLVATLGLSALISRSTFAFTLVKYMGAAYLVYLGIVNLAKPGGHGLAVDGPGRQAPSAPWHDYRSGVLTNLLNPKVGLFFIAFFPQFISPARLESPVPFLVLGLTFAVIGFTWSLVLTWLAGAVSSALRRNESIGRWLGRLSGVVFILMGLQVGLDRT